MYFFIEEWQFVNEFRHIVGKILLYSSIALTQHNVHVHDIVGISRVFSDSNGTAVILIDDKSDAFVYSPVRYMNTLIYYSDLQILSFIR